MKSLLYLFGFITFLTISCKDDPEMEPSQNLFGDTISFEQFIGLPATDPISCESTPNNIDSLRSLWHINQPKSYTYRINKSCFCVNLFTYQVVIINNELDTAFLFEPNFKSVEPPLDSTTVVEKVRQEVSENYLIDQLWANYKETIENDPYQAIIEIHPGLHYPCSAFFDWEEGLADDEFSYQIDYFRVLEE
ncbi:MAG: DUF6174 domain-containing protein [Marinoscillum sp.]